MRNTVQATLLFLLLTTAYSCRNSNNEKNNAARENTIITGEFYNTTAFDSLDNIGLYVQDYLNKEVTNTEKQVDSSGNFRFEFKVKEKQVVLLLYKTITELIVEPGDSIHIKIDASMEDRKDVLGSISLSGTSTSINQNIIDYYSNEPINYNQLREQRYSLTPTAYRRYLDSVYKVQSNYIDKLLTSGKFSEPFLGWLEAQKTFAEINTYVFYEFYFGSKLADNGEQTNSGANATTKYDLDNLPPVKEEYKINRIVSNTLPKKLLDFIIITSENEAMKFEPELRFGFYLEELIAAYSNNPEMLKLVINQMANTILDQSIEQYEINEALIDSILGNSKFKTALTEKYTFKKSKQQNPELNKQVSIQEYASSNSDSLLMKIVSDAKGKPIYIDNWATWCKPCLSEFKQHSPQLISKFEDKIEFVFLCYRSEKEQWKSVISEYNLKGKHYYIEKNQIEELLDLFSIEGFPTYTLINNEGQIVYSNSSLRPGNERTSIILDSLSEK